ncbi:hypothetical protein D3C87_2122960 [compost metagenome]
MPVCIFFDEQVHQHGLAAFEIPVDVRLGHLRLARELVDSQSENDRVLMPRFSSGGQQVAALLFLLLCGSGEYV